MELYLKITVGVLLLVQAFHLASLQYSTDSPGRTIDKSWLRERAKNIAGSENAAVVPTEYDLRDDGTATESNEGGIPSGFMYISHAGDDNVTSEDRTADEEPDDLPVVNITALPTIQNVTTDQPELKVSPTTTPMDPKNSSQINMTDTEKEFNNSVTTLQNSTSDQNTNQTTTDQNTTDLQMTTLAPKGNDTQISTTKSDKDILTNDTESNNTTDVTTVMPEINKTPTTSSSTTALLPETTEMIPETTTSVPPDTPEMANKTEKGSGTGTSSERGLESDPQRSKRNKVWGAVLGTIVAASCVGLVAYIILKNKQQKAFVHQKLVEEYPSESVHRLDNSEPLDLNYGGSAYYNPGLQGDNIQMTSFPGRH
uniref:mucin-15 n=1 Tax=Scatophagus argus TaxID=75038 RepID=UPI001ED7E24B|nr:mucin-15 [Scatophagus argus]XP_046250590.1 mucin-15 [Scatophagus argus]